MESSSLQDRRRRVEQLLLAGQAVDAEAECRRAVATDPDVFDGHVVLGDLLRWLGRPAEAMAVYHNVLLRGQDLVDARAGLAAALRDLGQPDAARRTVSRALMISPVHADALCADAALRLDAEDFEGAAAGFLQVLDTAPQAVALHAYVGVALYSLHARGATARASALATRWLDRFPDDPTVRHLAGSLIGRPLEPRAPDGYVKQTFDAFAPTFDQALHDLDYRAPQLLAQAVAESGMPAAGVHAALDAGCGTGLCAAWLRPMARHLTGVDLSSAMLARARARHAYDTLVEAELTAFLSASPAQFDLIVAADVLCYFGDLHEVLARAATALVAGGTVAFTLETLAGEADGYRAGAHGRFAHREAHVRDAVDRAGLQPRVFARERLRLESGQPVEGFVVVAVNGDR